MASHRALGWILAFHCDVTLDKSLNFVFLLCLEICNIHLMG